MSAVRFLMLLALVVWVGGIIFFAFVVAPAAFAVLPSHQMAGNVVNRALPILHWMGIVSGLVFLAAGMVASRGSGATGSVGTRSLLVAIMVLLTLISQAGVSRRMSVLRAEMGTIDVLARSDPRRAEFNRLHGWSTGIEGTVLALGLVVVYLTAREMR
jgi:uncharacterized membrane protein